MNTGESKGKDLFIVDNSVSGWTGLHYLEEWTRVLQRQYDKRFKYVYFTEDLRLSFKR